MSGRPWTQEEIERLRQLREEGLTYREIAQRLARSRVAVKHKGRMLDADRARPWRAWTQEDDARLDALRRAGRSHREIAISLDRSVRAIKRRCAGKRRLGVLDDEALERLDDLHAQGATNEEIALALECSISTVSRRCTERGLIRLRPWTMRELAQLRSMIEEGQGLDAIVEALDRTPKAIAHVAAREGLALPVPARRWSAWADGFAMRHLDELGYAGVARALDRTVRGVQHRIYKLRAAAREEGRG